MPKLYKISFFAVIFLFSLFYFLFPVNVFAGNAQIATGYYVGSGIAKSITEIGFQPALVIIKSDTSAGAAVYTSSAISAGLSHLFNNSILKNNTTHITSLDSDGFTIGTNAAVNSINIRYTWIAFGGSDCSATGNFCVGSYVGDGSNPQSITTVGFQPDLVLIQASHTSATNAAFRNSLMATSTTLFFDAITRITNGTGLRDFTPTGFDVGTGLNVSGRIHLFIAFKYTSGLMTTGTYTGNGTDNTSITLASSTFQPDFVWTKLSSSTNQRAVMRNDQFYGDSSITFSGTVQAINQIQGASTTSFEVGTSNLVNGGGSDYFYAAFKKTSSYTPSGVFTMKTGSYTGNGTTQTISGLGFKPALVVIKGSTSTLAVWRSELMGGGNASTSLDITSIVNYTNAITALTNDGFFVADNKVVNSNGDTYNWIAFGNSTSTNFKVGAYTGDAQDDRSITGIGFQPDLVWVKRIANGARWRSSSMSGDISQYFGATAQASDIIQALESDGFQVGTSINEANLIYFYVAFKNTTNQFSVGTYTGNGSANRSITTSGINPDWVIVKATSSDTGVHRSDVQTGDTTQLFTAVVDSTLNIDQLNDGGFRIDTNASVNGSGETYYWAAWQYRTATDTVVISQSGGSTAVTEGGATDTYTIVLNKKPDYDVEVTVSPDADVSVSASDLWFHSTDWDTPQTITVTAVDDSDVEGNHTGTITHSASSTDVGYSGISISSVVANITDNDGGGGQPTIQFSSATSSGSESVTSVSLIVQLSATSSQTVTVNYSATGGTATGGGTDYTLANGTSTITAGNATTSISLSITNDSDVEQNETVIITLSNPINATLGANGSSTYTIIDNDIPTIQFTSVNSNGDESVTSVNLQLSLSAATNNDVTVNYSATGGSATGGGTDYTLADGVATITAGNTTTNVSATIVNDEIEEQNETIIVTISSPSNATLGSNTTHTYTIIDNEGGGGQTSGGGFIPRRGFIKTLRSFFSATRINYLTPNSLRMSTTTPTLYSTSSALTSSIFDAGQNVAFKNIVWWGTKPATSEVGFQIAVSNASSGPWFFYGPDCTIGTLYTPASGVPMRLNSTGTCSVYNKRFLRYRLFATSTSDRLQSPTINSINFTFAE